MSLLRIKMSTLDSIKNAIFLWVLTVFQIGKDPWRPSGILSFANTIHALSFLSILDCRQTLIIDIGDQSTVRSVLPVRTWRIFWGSLTCQKIKMRHFQMFNGQSIRGRFERDGWTRIVGNEGDLKVCYQIQEGKLVETITGNGFTFKQVSTENLYCSKLGINWYFSILLVQIKLSDFHSRVNLLNDELEIEFSDVLTWNVLNLCDTIILIIEFLVT